MLKSFSETEQLQGALDDAIPERNWLRILEVFVPTGVADNLQIQEISGLDRNRLRRFLEKMEQSALGLPPVLETLETSARRINIHGRPPKIYLLGKSGAALLQANGYENVRQCALKNEIAVSHALAMLSLHHAAQQAGCLVQTDQNLSYGNNGQVLRPDHQLALPDGDQALYEIEQDADRKLVSRILESLKNKQAFFQTEESKAFLPEVRMVLNLEYGQRWNRTLNVWREACKLVAEQTKLPLGFKLLAIPILEFLRTPEWDVELSPRWQDVTAPAKKRSLPEKDNQDEVEEIATLGITHSIAEDCILLEALKQDYVANKLHELPKPELKLFELARVIYFAREVSWMAPPYTSIYLFKCYLELHPDLVTNLRKAIHSGRGRMYWSPKTILHRMQMVINTFMAYYGFRVSNSFQIFATVEPEEGTSQFSVKVEVLYEHLSSDYVEAVDTQKSLAWMLWALFEYGAELGLGKPEFW